MAQRINPNVLKLNISKGPIYNVYYKTPLQYYQEDLYLQQFLHGFFFSFNLLTSEIIINRDFSTISCNVLLKASSLDSGFLIPICKEATPLKKKFVSKYHTIDYLYLNEIK